jgi:hypothetical protein
MAVEVGLALLDASERAALAVARYHEQIGTVAKLDLLTSTTAARADLLRTVAQASAGAIRAMAE